MKKMKKEFTRKDIKKALAHYKECKTKEAGYELIRAMRNGIETIGNVTIADLYNDTIAFNKLVQLARKA